MMMIMIRSIIHAGQCCYTFDFKDDRLLKDDILHKGDDVLTTLMFLKCSCSEH